MIPRNTPFWDRVRIQDVGCWEWTAGRQRAGYGNYRDRGAHRVAWELTNGPIPKGLFVCHHCDNPPCVRPDHLYLGTNRENLWDARARGLLANGEQHWNAKLTEPMVREMVALRKTGWTHRELAERYGVRRESVRDIFQGRNWRRVTDTIPGAVKRRVVERAPVTAGVQEALAL